MFVSSRTPNDLIDELAAGLVAAGVPAHRGEIAAPGVWHLEVDGTDVLVQPYRHPGSRPEVAGGGPVALVEVADRVPDWRRAELRAARSGWLDRRGHLRLWAPRCKVELDFAPTTSGGRRRQGDVRLEVALWALTHPANRLSVRPVARAIGRSAAQVSAVVGGWVDEGLVDRERRPDLDALFWALVDAWPTGGWVRASDDDLARAQADEVTVDVGDAVAERHGAQIGLGAAGPDHRYVTDPAAWGRLARVVEGRDDTIPENGPRHWCRPAPTRWLPMLGDDAHPVVVAARLAAGERRGREIVEAWGVLDRLAGWALP